MLHVAFVRSDVATRHDHVDRRRPRRRRSTASSPCSPAPISTRSCWRAGWTTPARPAQQPFYRVLAEGDVRFVGEPIVLVVATSRYIAEDACELVVVDIEPLPAVVGVDAALAEDAPARAPRARRATSPAPSPPAPTIPSSRPPSPAPPTCHPHVRPAALRLRARWRPAASSPAGTRPAAHRRAHLHPGPARRAQLPRPGPRHRRERRPGDDGRRRRRLRPEDVHARPTSSPSSSPAGSCPAPLKWIEDRRENLVAGLHARDDRMTLQHGARRRGSHPRRARRR